MLISTESWRRYGGPDFPANSWTIEDDVLHARAASPRVDLISVEAYADFDFSIEWMLPVGGNSGILYRVAESAGEAWHSGLEMQLLHDAGHPDGQRPETSCGALYALIAPSKARAVPPGEFHTARVSVRGQRVEHWMNGERVLFYDIDSADFQSRVARSKFKSFPGFAKATRGHLVLQHHGSEVWFRNARIDVPEPR